MPDKRRHRGAHPQDKQLFAGSCLTSLRSAVTDASQLLTKGYAEKASLKLVGDHFNLTARQRLAVLRASSSDQQIERRREHQVPAPDLAGKQLVIDGYNLLITIEAALSGGYVFVGRDGCLRDLAGLHGTYRKVDETLPALALIGESLSTLNVVGTHWMLDQPVSNSGRLKGWICAMAMERGWPWDVTLVPNPDPVLAESEDIVVSADSIILDRCTLWTNLGAWIVDHHCPLARIVDLSV